MHLIFNRLLPCHHRATMVEPQLDGAIEVIPGRLYWAMYNETPRDTVCVCLCVYVSVCVPVYVSESKSTSMSVSVCLSVCL